MSGQPGGWSRRHAAVVAGAIIVAALSTRFVSSWSSPPGKRWGTQSPASYPSREELLQTNGSRNNLQNGNTGHNSVQASTKTIAEEVGSSDTVEVLAKKPKGQRSLDELLIAYDNLLRTDTHDNDILEEKRLAGIAKIEKAFAELFSAQRTVNDWAMLGKSISAVRVEGKLVGAKLNGTLFYRGNCLLQAEVLVSDPQSLAAASSLVLPAVVRFSGYSTGEVDAFSQLIELRCATIWFRASHIEVIKPGAE